MSSTNEPEGRAALLRRIDSDAALSAIRDVVIRAGGDASHDLDHALRVAVWTLRLGGDGVETREAIAAALLHDLDSGPKDAADAADASVRSAERAREILDRLGFSSEAVSRIADAIRDHSYSRGAVPASLLGRALQDADRLEALGAVGILRTVAVGVGLGAELFDAADPWARNRTRDDRRFTLDHFFTKLLQLAETLSTEAGRREARGRTAAMEDFLKQLGEEIGEPYERPAGGSG